MVAQPPWGREGRFFPSLLYFSFLSERGAKRLVKMLTDMPLPGSSPSAYSATSQPSSALIAEHNI